MMREYVDNNISYLNPQKIRHLFYANKKKN